MFRAVVVVVLGAMLAGCLATRQQVYQALRSRYLGRNVDEMVAQFGPPANVYAMGTGGRAYSWNLGQFVNLDRYSAQPVACRIKAIANAAGDVESLSTEDASNMGGESLCAQKLGLQR